MKRKQKAKKDKRIYQPGKNVYLSKYQVKQLAKQKGFTTVELNFVIFIILPVWATVLLLVV